MLCCLAQQGENGETEVEEASVLELCGHFVSYVPTKDLY